MFTKPLLPVISPAQLPVLKCFSSCGFYTNVLLSDNTSPPLTLNSILWLILQKHTVEHNFFFFFSLVFVWTSLISAKFRKQIQLNLISWYSNLLILVCGHFRVIKKKQNKHIINMNSESLFKLFTATKELWSLQDNKSLIQRALKSCWFALVSQREIHLWLTLIQKPLCPLWVSQRSECSGWFICSTPWSF